MLTSVCSTSNCVAFFNKVYFIEGQKPYWPQSRKKITNNHKMQSKKSWFFRRNIKLEWWYIPLFHKPTEEATSNRINLFLPNLTMPCKLSRKFPRLIEKRLSGLSSIKRILENLKDYHEQRRAAYFGSSHLTENQSKLIFLSLSSKNFSFTIKIKYSCIVNIKSKITTHNRINWINQ